MKTIIQIRHHRWAKGQTGATFAEQRRKTPDISPLEFDGNCHGDIIIHQTAQIKKVEIEEKRQRVIDLTPLKIRREVDLLSLIGYQGRKIGVIAPEQWLQIKFNWRSNPLIGHQCFFQDNVVNIGLTEHPSELWFVETTPKKVIDLRSDMYRRKSVWR